MNGFDWNGNDRVDAGDWYIDYEIMSDEGHDGGCNHGSGGGSNGDGCSCLLLLFAGIMFLSIFW